MARNPPCRRCAHASTRAVTCSTACAGAAHRVQPTQQAHKADSVTAVDRGQQHHHPECGDLGLLGRLHPDQQRGGRGRHRWCVSAGASGAWWWPACARALQCVALSLVCAWPPTPALRAPPAAAGVMKLSTAVNAMGRYTDADNPYLVSMDSDAILVITVGGALVAWLATQHGKARA